MVRSAIERQRNQLLFDGRSSLYRRPVRRMRAAVTAMASKLSECLPGSLRDKARPSTDDVQRDEALASLVRLLNDEQVASVLIVGATAEDGITRAVAERMRGFEWPKKLLCVNRPTAGFLELRDALADHAFVQCRTLSPESTERHFDLQRTELWEHLFGNLERLDGGDAEQKNRRPAASQLKRLMQENEWKGCDCVVVREAALVDDSDLDETCGARLLMVVRTESCQNYRMACKILTHRLYTLIARSESVFGGYVVLQKLNQSRAALGIAGVLDLLDRGKPMCEGRGASMQEVTSGFACDGGRWGANGTEC